MGQSFTVASNEGEEHLRKVAALVDTKMRELSSGAHAVTTVNVAILAALNIASEYEKLKDQQQVVEHTIDRLSLRVQQLLKE